MTESRLSNLAILSIEREHIKKINFDAIIEKFAEKKTRTEIVKNEKVHYSFRSTRNIIRSVFFFLLFKGSWQ